MLLESPTWRLLQHGVQSWLFSFVWSSMVSFYQESIARPEAMIFLHRQDYSFGPKEQVECFGNGRYFCVFSHVGWEEWAKQNAKEGGILPLSFWKVQPTYFIVSRVYLRAKFLFFDHFYTQKGITTLILMLPMLCINNQHNISRYMFWEPTCKSKTRETVERATEEIY